MTVHPSLSSKDKGKRRRSVLKRFERLKELLAKEKWNPGDSVFGLPKLKTLRWKLKKVKKAVEAEATGAEETPEATTSEATAGETRTAKAKEEGSGKKQSKSA